MKRLVLGVTGGIASGKSTVIALLKKAGIPAICSDDIAHEAIRKGSPVYKRILRRFGSSILDSKGHILRSQLGSIVFQDAQERKWLERQIHPVVVRKLKGFIRKHKGIVALDIPLLYEAKLDRLVDQTLVIYAGKSAQVERLHRRNGMDRKEALLRIAAQMPLSAKRKRADVVIFNTGSHAKLHRDVANFIATIQGEASHGKTH